MSLRLRLALGLAVILTAALTVLGVAIVGATRTQLMADTRELVERALFNRINAGPPPTGTEPAPRDPRGLATAHLIFDRDGSRAVVEPAGPPSAPLAPPNPTDEQIAALRDGREVTATADDGSLDYLVIGALTDDGRLEVEAAPLADVDANLDALALRFAVGGGVTLLLAIGSIVWFVRRGLRPLDHIVDTANAVAAGELDARPQVVSGPAEIRHLATALDTMLVEQQSLIAAKSESEQRLRRFVSDASHELQTPVTSILGWTQLLRRGALSASESEVAQGRIEAEARRLGGLVDDMLLLARLDEGRGGARRRVDLAAIAQDAVLDAGAIDATRPVRFRSVPAWVEGDPDRLRQVVDNLLRNVRTHTPSGTTAEVTISIDAETAVLRVADDGPGIDPDHLAHVVDRFWRADDDTSGRTEGAGLGLAIVDAIVRSHGGILAVENGSGGGACFTVRIPADRPADDGNS